MSIAILLLQKIQFLAAHLDALEYMINIVTRKKVTVKFEAGWTWSLRHEK